MPNCLLTNTQLSLCHRILLGAKKYILHSSLHNKNFDHSQRGKQVQNTTPDANDTQEIKEMRKDGKKSKQTEIMVKEISVRLGRKDIESLPGYVSLLGKQ